MSNTTIKKKKKEVETDIAWFDQSDADKTKFLEAAVFDCSFKVGTDAKNVPVLKSYRVILTSVSPVFERMFHGNFKEAQDPEGITIMDADANVFENFLTTILIPNVESKNPAETLIGLVELAKRYQIDQLYAKFVKQIVDGVDSKIIFGKDVLTCFVFAQQNDIKDVITACTKYLKRSLQEGRVQLDFFIYDLDATVFYELLKAISPAISGCKLFHHIDMYARINNLERKSPLGGVIQRKHGEAVTLEMMLDLVDYKKIMWYDFCRGPANSKILSSDEKLQILKYLAEYYNYN